MKLVAGEPDSTPRPCQSVLPSARSMCRLSAYHAVVWATIFMMLPFATAAPTRSLKLPGKVQASALQLHRGSDTASHHLRLVYDGHLNHSAIIIAASTRCASSVLGSSVVHNPGDPKSSKPSRKQPHTLAAFIFAGRTSCTDVKAAAETFIVEAVVPELDYTRPEFSRLTSGEDDQDEEDDWIHAVFDREHTGRRAPTDVAPYKIQPISLTQTFPEAYLKRRQSENTEFQRVCAAAIVDRFDVHNDTRLVGKTVPENEIIEWFKSHSVLIVGDSTQKHALMWLHSQGVRNACSGGYGVCGFGPGVAGDASNAWNWCKNPISSPLTNRTDWDAVLWNNAGLHWLHLGTIRGVPVTGAEDYRSATKNCARNVATIFTESIKLVALSTSICSTRFFGEYAKASDVWRKKTSDPAYSMQFNEIGSTTLNSIEMEAASENGQQTVDSLTKDMCECTADGRHYPNLAPIYLHRLKEHIERIQEEKRSKTF